MQNFMQFLMMKMDKASEAEGGGAKPEAASATPNSSDNPPSQGEGDQHDDLGYAIQKKEGDKNSESAGTNQPEQKKPEAEKIESPASGYGNEPPKVEDKPTPPAQAEEIKLDFELKTDALPKDEEAKLKSFFKSNNVSKEVAQALVDQRLTELKQQEQARVDAEKEEERYKNQTRAQWHSELKNDPTFGGEKFGANIHRAEKVLEQFMPNTKKRLTESKAMLPPYVMRDLANLADHLYATEKLAQGGPSIPNQNDKEDDDPLSFYNS